MFPSSTPSGDAVNDGSSYQQPFSTALAPTRLFLDVGAEGILRQDAAGSYPNEACGFLFGTWTADGPRAMEALPVPNRASGVKRRRFAVSPAEYQAAERYAESRNMELVGIYHSHPDHPAEPSEHDRSQALPGLSYAIVSVQNGRPDTLTSWALNSARIFEPETVASF